MIVAISRYLFQEKFKRIDLQKPEKQILKCNIPKEPCGESCTNEFAFN